MARIKGPKKTNSYPHEFKTQAVRLANHPDILARDTSPIFITRNGYTQR